MGDRLEGLSHVDDPVALNAEIDGAVGSRDAGLHHVSTFQVLLPVGLNLHEHLPLGRLGEQRRDPLPPGRGNAERAPCRRARREQVADMEVVDARKFGQRLGRPIDEVGDAVLLRILPLTVSASCKSLSLRKSPGASRQR